MKSPEVTQSTIIWSQHALIRFQQRFPMMTWEKVNAELKEASPPTKKQSRLIAIKSKRRKYQSSERLVSNSHIVFVLEKEIIITLYPLPTATQAALAMRRKTNKEKPLSRYTERRKLERRPIIRIIEEEE